MSAVEALVRRAVDLGLLREWQLPYDLDRPARVLYPAYTRKVRQCG